MMKRMHVLAAAAALALPAAVPQALANPGEERIILEHVDQGKLVGTLDADVLARLREAGQRLFEGHFTEADGVGRPMATQAIIPTKRPRHAANPFSRTAGMDSNGCFDCHSVPVIGGAGNFSANAFVSEGFESSEFDSLDPQFSNERGSIHLMGAGLVELLAREMTVELQAIRPGALEEARRTGAPVEAPLVAKGVHYGTITAGPDGMLDISRIEGVDADLVVRPFSQKGVMTSLRQFAINAFNQHVGMEARERFGARWTGSHDFDEDGTDDEMLEGDVSATVAFIAGLKPPTQKVPDDPAWKEAARHGLEVFAALGCEECHRPSLPLASLKFPDPGPSDMAGTMRTGEMPGAVYDLGLLEWAAALPRNEKGEVLVPLFGDLKRHTIADQQVAALGNELLAQRFVERNVFMTAELWGAGSTHPYGHRNDMTSLDQVIRAHGGEGRAARDAYVGAPDADRAALVAFLKTLVIEP
jgi:hypothetical protein